MQILSIILILRLTTRTRAYILLMILKHLLKTKISIMSMHLTDDLDIGRIIIEKIQIILALVVIEEL